MKSFINVYNYAAAEKHTVLPDIFLAFFISKMEISKNFIILKNLKNICKFSEFYREFNDTIYRFQLKN